MPHALIDMGSATGQRRSDSGDMARRARRLAQGLSDADRDCLLAYAEELEYGVAPTERVAETQAHHQTVT